MLVKVEAAAEAVMQREVKLACMSVKFLHIRLWVNVPTFLALQCSDIP